MHLNWLSIVLLVVIALIAVAFWILWRKFPIHLIVRSKRHLESIFDSIPDPIAIIDRNFKLRRINSAYASQAKRRFQDIIGGFCHAFFPKCDNVCEECLLGKVFKDGAPHQFTGRQLTREGQERFYDFYFFPLRDKRAGEVVSITEYIKDVTEETIAKRDLEAAKKSVEEAYAFLREEIELAKEIQQNILPNKWPELEGMRIDASYAPADSVGGDLYDFIMLGNYRLGVFLGDVSGHGLPAAFVAAMTKMLLYTHSRNEYSTKRALERVNRDLNRNLSTGHYLTATYGILDLNNNTFTFTRASHPFPLLVHADGTMEQLDTSGMFVGMVEEAQYGEKTIQLQQHDRLYFFTDGFYEFQTPKRKMIGREGFSEMLRCMQDVPVSQVADAVNAKIHEYYGSDKLDDDRSMIVLEITEKSRIDRFRLLFDFTKEEDIVVATFFTYMEAESYISMILREMDRHGYRDEMIRRMKVVVAELFANALEHGNRNDPGKKVDIAYVVDGRQVKIACIDEGDGFDVDSVPDPTLSENITKDRGRGIHIMKNFADEISQNEIGNRVTIVKYKRSAKTP